MGAVPRDSLRVVLGSDQAEMGRGPMKKRCPEEQIIGFLREADAGQPIQELCREQGFSEPSCYAWKVSSVA